MPRQDRTGPMGQGSRTGRGMGLCNSNEQRNSGRCFAGRGRRMGGMRRFGNFFGFGNRANSEKLDLQNYVSELEVELKEVKEALLRLEKNNNTDEEK